MANGIVTSGGKGNDGRFFEREPRICAAGIRSAQPNDTVADIFQLYTLQNEVDALLSDALHPPKINTPIISKRAIPSKEKDGVSQLINPPIKTKFQTIADDIKETVYSSSWKQVLGQVKDPVPMLPDGMDPVAITMGKKTPFHGRLYDIVMPKDPLPDKTPYAYGPGIQTDRKYCHPAFNPNLTFGYRTNVDKRGRYAKCAMKDKNDTEYTLINTVQSKFREQNQSDIGEVLAPNKNINEVAEGHSFGKLNTLDNLPEFLTQCALNPGKSFFNKCLSHLNALRKILKSKLLPSFFYTFYLHLKSLDRKKTGCLPKQIIYENCGSKMIRFDCTLIEPLLSALKAFDGHNIQFKTFVDMLDFRLPLPEFPKVDDIEQECIDYRTTYGEMTKPDQDIDTRELAGVPSRRYFDCDYPVTPERCCKADRTLLPHETDMKSCINPSLMTLMHMNHRDAYAERDKEFIREVFEDENLDDQAFNNVWEKAQKYHSQGLVCFETFRRALKEYNENDTTF